MAILKIYVPAVALWRCFDRATLPILNTGLPQFNTLYAIRKDYLQECFKEGKISCDFLGDATRNRVQRNGRDGITTLRVSDGRIFACVWVRNLSANPRSTKGCLFYKEAMMRVDLYRRPEIGGQYSYLAVPQGKPIPEEATNTDWEAIERDIDLEKNDEEMTGLSSSDAFQQINDKGYAITSIKHLTGIGHPM